MPIKKTRTKRAASPAGMTADRAKVEGVSTDNPRDPNAGARPERVSMGQGKNLDTPGVTKEADNYYYYWFSDRPGRIAKALQAYYEHVVNDMGEIERRGSSYLMRLPIKYREEDLRLKKEKVARTLAAETKLSDNEYAPGSKSGEGGQSSIVDRTVSDNPYS